MEPTLIQRTAALTGPRRESFSIQKPPDPRLRVQRLVPSFTLS
jgi:hypothetical protein